jgi:2,4-dienoyl-CoA reductase (NADPH2)
LREGKADFIAMTRCLQADPELPNKLAAGRIDDIAPCTACEHCFDIATRGGQPLQCRVNASLGREREYAIKTAAKPKNVMVVGGGPAGMEAARVAALRGHEVMLYDKKPYLGGGLPLAAMVKGTEIEDLPGLIRYLQTQITKAGVEIRLGKEVNASLIEETKPDVVILATGGIATSLELPGINRSNVVSSSKLHSQLKSYLKFFSPNFNLFDFQFVHESTPRYFSYINSSCD